MSTHKSQIKIGDTKKTKPGQRKIPVQNKASSKQKTPEEKVAVETVTTPELMERAAECCPYCESKDFVKRGVRKNKHQEVQLYVCRNIECGRTFTSRNIKGKQFPWPVVLDAISYHNLGYTFGQCSDILEAKLGMKPQAETVASWYEQYKPLCRFERLRPYAMKILASWREQAQRRYVAEVARNLGGTGKGDARKAQGNVGIGATKFNMVETTTLAHRQLYRFRYHRPKLILTLEEYKNRNFGRLIL